MKHRFIAILISCYTLHTSAQETLPSVKIKKLNGKEILASSIGNEGNPIIMSFWSTRCAPCIRELEAIASVYPQWQKETKVKVVLIATDDSRSSASVKSFLVGRGLEFECYLDVNQDLQRALNITLIPFTLILNGKGEIIYKHSGYSPGTELELFKILKNIEVQSYVH